MMQVRLVSIFTLLMVILAGCGGDDADKLAPPKINYGSDMSEMGMPVTDARFTVAVLPEGTDDWLLFDDIGEFLKYYQHESSDFQVIWIPDHNTNEFVHAEDAWFVQADQFCYSPMKWCVAAFGTEDSANAAHSEYGGEIWHWDSIFDADWSEAPAPAEHHH